MHINAPPTRRRAAIRFFGLRNVSWPNARKFCARGAPKFQEFCKFFARCRCKICVISTPDARLFECQRPHDLVESFEDVIRFSAHAGLSASNFLCARRAENFQNVCNSFARFWRNVCVISTPNACFFGSERIFDSVNSALFCNMRSVRWPNERTVLCARRAGSPEILQFLRASLTQKLRDIDARRALFSTHF